MANKKVILSADGATATVADATISDIFTTLISSNEAVTGTYGLFQRGALFVGGMAVQSKRKSGTWNPL
jgi:hypothetical protein